MSTLAQRGRQARESAGISSQSELARAIDKKPQTIQSIESGFTKRSKYLPDIAAATGTRLDWLITGNGAMRNGERAAAPTIHTLDSLAAHTGTDDAILEITDRDYAPEFLVGDMVTVRPLQGATPRSSYVAIAGKARAGIRGVMRDADGVVLLNTRTGEASTPGDVRIIGDLVKIERNLLQD